MRDLAELNINEGGKPVKRAAPTRDVIESFQAHFSITLPGEYLLLLQYSNGGHPQLDSIKPIGSPELAPWSVNRFYHLEEDRTSHGSLWRATEEWRSAIGHAALPFASDGGGNQFFLDLGTSPPSVKVCVHDEQFAVVDVAPSFGAFVDSLSIAPDMI